MLINDHFQNFKVYQIPRAQLIIADIPYNIGKNAYGFEIKKPFFKEAVKWIEDSKLRRDEIKTLGYAKTEISKIHPILF